MTTIPKEVPQVAKKCNACGAKFSLVERAQYQFGLANQNRLRHDYCSRNKCQRGK